MALFFVFSESGEIPSNLVLMHPSFSLLHNLITTAVLVPRSKHQRILSTAIQAGISQLVAHQLVNIEVMGSDPGKGNDFYKKI